MTTAADSIASIRDDLAVVLPRARDVKARLLELTRGGHRPASFSTGPSGGDTLLPTHDTADLALNQLRRDYTDGVRNAARELRRARNAQTKILARARIKPADVEEPSPTDDVWCLSCLRVDAFIPRGDPKRQGTETKLCTWCHDNRTSRVACEEEGGELVIEWPALELVRLHTRAQEQGRHITSKMLKEAGIEA